MYLGHIFMVNLPRTEIAHSFKTVLWNRKQGRASFSKTTNTTFRYIEYEDIKKKEFTKALDTCNTMCAGDQKENCNSVV